MKILIQSLSMPRSSSRSFSSALRRHQARVSITQPTVRGHGSGTLHAAWEFLARDLDLRRLRSGSERAYLRHLDEATTAFMKRLGTRKGGAKSKASASWGLARKLLNIYIRDCVYSRMLCEHYRLAGIEPFLEVPLDSFVAKGLIAEATARGQTRRLPRWSTIKGLRRADSDLYQRFASDLAAEYGHARIHLDVLLWGNR
ncbi:MAG: hypothetical protein ACKOYN_11635 [Planctomycetota bacterium]